MNLDRPISEVRRREEDQILNKGIAEEIKEEYNINLSESVLKRLELLGKLRIDKGNNGGMVYVSHLYDSMEIYHMAPDDKKEIKVAALLHDIGKTGPVDADVHLQNLIVDIFALVDPNTSENITVNDFLIKLDRENDKGMLEQAGISPDMNIHDFFSLHAQWTADILENEDLSQEIKYAAANHHGILNRHEIQIKNFEPKEEDKNSALWIGIIDYFQALLKRGNYLQPDAIEELREKFEDKIKPEQKDELERILNYLEKQPSLDLI